MFFVCDMDVVREQYNMKYHGKHEILLLNTWLLYLYLPPNWVGKYLGTYHNNVTRISSAVFHDVYRYMYTLFPWPCLQHYCKYDNHEVVLHSYRLQKYNWVFLQTFCSVHFDFCLWGVSDNNCAMLTGKNAYFCKI